MAPVNIPSSTPCDDCGAPACWLCSTDGTEDAALVLCDPCHARRVEAGKP